MPKPGSTEWKQRLAFLLAGESKRPLGLYYTSFAGDGGFLGATVVEARGPTSASNRYHQLGLYPGGESVTLEIPPEQAHLIPLNMRNRLLSREEAENLGEPVPKKTGRVR